ncbi:alpha/beta hydrolase [Streptomyces sp. NPDC059076]|uniref:alpha/beta hydrolase n=1 Tax=unclassified Streptomyces TaxID=2593676 RepID=UPI0036B09897
MPTRLTRITLASVLALLIAVLLPQPSADAQGSRGADRVRVVEERRVAPRIVDLTLDTPSLDTPGKVRLLTPDGWDERDPRDRWPVLYLLSGGDGDHETWTREYLVQDRPELREVLVVMPSMPLYGFYSDWWNHGKGGPPAVETFHLDEVMPLLERTYGAGKQRVAAGESQGGYGALSYAAHRPGLFRAVASFSGFVHPSQNPRAVRAGMTYLGLDWLALWGDPVLQRARWHAHDPYYLAERLRGTRVHLSSGDGTKGELDPPDVQPDPHVPGLEDPDNPFPAEVISPSEAIMEEQSKLLAGRLAAVGVQLSTHFYAGTHSPPYWWRELERTLPALLAELGPTDRRGSRAQGMA